MKESKFNSHVIKKLEKFPDNFVVGIAIPGAGYEATNINLLDFLINKKKLAGSYVSISKPHAYVINLLKTNGISHNNIHFIDCITKSLGEKSTQAKKCVFVDSPAHLTDLSVAIHDFFKSSRNKNQFIYIDSLSSLRLHNNLNSVLRFVHNITGKMRIFGFSGLMLSLREDDDKRLMTELSQFCDEVIHK
jgi:hypothetical protein|tara:strand:- start:798 stop:1367 length:570 start_codon:yes stop_codon:yes gene_type:complete